MTPRVEPEGPTPEILVSGIKSERSTWIDWVTTTDHKKIGILYLFTTFIFFLVGGAEALLLRIQLGAADNTFLDPQTYNQIFTLHGTTMIFLFLVPVFAGFANYFLPLMIGARDVAFPRLNMLSWWLLVFGGVTLYASLLWSPPEAGWTSYAPLSENTFLPGSGIDTFIVALHLVGASTVIGAINFIATIKNMRAPGMSWSRLPLFVWSVLIYAVLILIATPAIAGALAMLLVDRQFGGSFFDPATGGNAMLWQHLFWFYSHPAVYIMVLPAFGMVSEVIPVFARKRIFGQTAMAASMAVIGFMGLLVWAHHMFTTPLPTVVLIIFMLTTMVIAIPTGVKVFNWLATLWRGSVTYTVPMIFALGFLALFVIGGVTGVMLSIVPIDWQTHDTYFVVAHFHFTMFGGGVFGLFAGLYYWFPKMSGRMMNEALGKLSFLFMFIGFLLTFLIQHSLGLSGMVRRIYEYSESAGFATENLISTIGSFVLGLGVLLTIVNVLYSLKRGRKAGPDPWRGNTLEWFTESPPPENNFDEIPVVTSLTPMLDIREQVERESGQKDSELNPAP